MIKYNLCHPFVYLFSLRDSISALFNDTNIICFICEGFFLEGGVQRGDVTWFSTVLNLFIFYFSSKKINYDPQHLSLGAAELLYFFYSYSIRLYSWVYFLNREYFYIFHVACWILFLYQRVLKQNYKLLTVAWQFLFATSFLITLVTVTSINAEDKLINKKTVLQLKMKSLDQVKWSTHRSSKEKKSKRMNKSKIAPD